MSKINAPVTITKLGQLSRHELGGMWAHCEACQRYRQLDGPALLERFGPECSIDRIRDGVKCDRCGGPGKFFFSSGGYGVEPLPNTG